jgi:hypothetical protein
MILLLLRHLVVAEEVAASQERRCGSTAEAECAKEKDLQRRRSAEEDAGAVPLLVPLLYSEDAGLPLNAVTATDSERDAAALHGPVQQRRGPRCCQERRLGGGGPRREVGRRGPRRVGRCLGQTWLLRPARGRIRAGEARPCGSMCSQVGPMDRGVGEVLSIEGIERGF